MITKAALEHAIKSGVSPEEIFMLLSSPIWHQLIETRRSELLQDIIRLEYRADAELANSYRNLQRSLQEVTEFDKFRNEFISAFQQRQSE